MSIDPSLSTLGLAQGSSTSVSVLVPLLPLSEDSQEEAMVIHSSILAWRISWTEEPGGLYSP